MNFKLAAAIGGVLALAACGSAAGLRPADGHDLPVAPVGARERPTAQQLLTPPPQARPARSDDLLVNSQYRRSDPFDPPPD